MREKLIELLQCSPTDIMGNHGIGALADHLIANGITLATDNNVGCKWIPVSERLPEGDKVVLCYKADRGIRFGKLLDATYANGVQVFMDRDRVFAFDATHWMLLPEPPKEGKE